MKEEKGNTNFLKEIVEWIGCIFIAVSIALLVRYYIGTPTIVQNKSMYPTLIEGERLILNRFSRTIKEPLRRGEIVTFEAPIKESSTQVTKENPKAIYLEEGKNPFYQFTYHVLEWGKTNYIKRVIGLEGEHVQIKDGKVYINEEILQEDYLQSDITTQGTLEDLIVPEGYVYVMGDNRPNSYDSRSFGCIPIEKIESKVWIRFWPFNRWGHV